MLSQQSQEGLRNLAPGAKSVSKSGAQSGWFRVGMAAAALGAPLIARWNSLRKRQSIEVPAAPVVARGRLSGLTANAQSALGAAQATLGDRLDDARGAARSLVASQPRAKAAIQAAQTLVAQSQPRAQAALKTVRSATDAARDVAQTTAQQMAKGRDQLADALDAVRDAADVATATAIKVAGKGKAAQARITGARKVAGARIETTGKMAQLAVRRNVRRNTTLWLTGIGVGVAVAGVTAYIVMRRRMNNATENDALVELRGVSVGALTEDDADGRLDQALMERDVAQATSSATTTTSTNAPSGAATGGATGTSDMGATGNLSDLLDDDTDEPDAILIIETEMDNSAPTDDVSAAIDKAADDTGADYIDSPEVADNPAFIGNIHTLIYHPADSDTLPAEENQIFFASEEQAIAAGYRRSKRSSGNGGENGEDTNGK